MVKGTAGLQVQVQLAVRQGDFTFTGVFVCVPATLGTGGSPGTLLRKTVFNPQVKRMQLQQKLITVSPGRMPVLTPQSKIHPYL